MGLERHCNARIALESPFLGYLVGHVYRMDNADFEGKTGSTAPRSCPFGALGFLKPIHPSKLPGQRLVCAIFSV